MVFLATALALQTPALLADLPFEHAPGRIWLRGTLNGVPARTMLDSGAGGIVVTEAAASRAGGTKGEAFRANTVGGLVDAWWASGMMLGLEGAPMQVSVTAIAASERMPEVAAGMPLFSVFGVAVDYVARRVRIYSPTTYVAPLGSTPLRLAFKDGVPLVRMELRMPGGKPREVVAMVDTGSPVEIEVTRRLARREGMDRRYVATAVTDQTGGVGGPTRARLVSGAEAELGGTKVGGTAAVDVTEEGSAGRRADYDVLLGDGVLRHFDLGFDYLRSTLWVRPNGK